uniref:Uncharacterized protein n=1 Tax=Oryza nivara TaxID=4536 RepID=A0A0E0GBK0_ORYNI
MSSSTAASIGPPQPPPPPTSPEEEKCLNLELWHACSSPLVCLPSVGTRVVYFPQGHSEQVSWLSAMGCSLLVSMVSLVCLVLLQGKPSKTMVDCLAIFVVMRQCTARWCFFSKTLAEREAFYYVVDNAAVMDFITVNTSGSILINMLKPEYRKFGEWGNRCIWFTTIQFSVISKDLASYISIQPVSGQTICVGLLWEYIIGHFLSSTALVSFICCSKTHGFIFEGAAGCSICVPTDSLVELIQILVEMYTHIRHWCPSLLSPSARPHSRRYTIRIL